MLIFGIVVLMVLQLNIYMLESNTQQTLRMANQEMLSDNEIGRSFCGMLEDEIGRIGVGDTIAPSITVADSNRISFRTDVGSNGVVDSVSYYVAAGTIPSGGNPRLKFLYRRQNFESANGGGVGVTSFRFDYLDDRGRLLPAPVTGSSRSLIRSVKMKGMFESTVRLKNSGDSTFAAAYWETIKSPVSIR